LPGRRLRLTAAGLQLGEVMGDHLGQADLPFGPGGPLPTQLRGTLGGAVAGYRGGQEPDRDRQRGAHPVAVAAQLLLPVPPGQPGLHGLSVVKRPGDRVGSSRKPGTGGGLAAEDEQAVGHRRWLAPGLWPRHRSFLPARARRVAEDQHILVHDQVPGLAAAAGLADGEERGPGAPMLPSGIEPPFEAGQAAALRERLAKPARLVALTPLGTRAMRERMLAEGREAGLVGELSGATPAELLGTVAEHYTTSSAPEEIAIWRAAHGGSLDPLVQAVRDCPFLSRRVALLKTLARSVPEGTELLAELIRDPALGPVVLLAERDDLSPQDADPDEAAWIMAGSVLELLEIGGPEAVREQLKNLPPAQRKDIVRAVSASGYPAPETLEEFRTLVAEPILHTPARPHAVQGTRRPRSGEAAPAVTLSALVS
jgi:hypothetical protein